MDRRILLLIKGYNCNRAYSINSLNPIYLEGYFTRPIINNYVLHLSDLILIRVAWNELGYFQNFIKGFRQ